ncbi:MAG: VWA domain-containing protein [Acidobacteria bacterium]|nr:VWA domain-containing protein [Acidobacteriota bacterium]
MKPYKTFAILILLSYFSLVSFGQVLPSKSVTSNSEEDFLVKIGTDLVALDVTVTDVKGNYILDLKPEDFEIREDGQLRQLDFFQPSTELKNTSLSLVLALDLSGSLSIEEANLQKEAIKKFTKQLDQNSFCALMGFNYKVDIFQDFTNDHKKINNKLDKIKDYGGSTRIYDALDRAVTMFKKAPLVRGGKRLRPVILVITDGFDSSSIIDKKELIRRANLSGVSIYSITLPSFSPLLNQASKERLPTLLDVSGVTRLTGGRDFSVSSQNYQEVFEAIAKEFASSYTLAYHLPKEHTFNTLHKLEVKVKRSGLMVRANRDSYLVQNKQK